MIDRIRRRSILVCIVAMGLLTPLAWAQAPAAVGYADREALEKGFKAAGYETKLTDSGGCRIMFNESDGWKFDFEVTVSPDKQKIVIFAYLTALPPIDKLPAKPLADLLVATHAASPAYFMLSDRKTETQLFLTQQFPNTPENAGKLRDHVNMHCRALRTTAKLWSKETWGVAPSTQPAEARGTQPGPG